MTIRVYIGIGSNLDNPVAQVLEAVEELEMIPDTILAERSTLYSGKPMGPEDQPDYVNAVVAMDTLLSADELHKALISIEDLQGRTRGGDKWGPRIIDLDLLLEEVAGNLKIPGQGHLYSLINKCKSHSLKKLITA